MSPETPANKTKILLIAGLVSLPLMGMLLFVSLLLFGAKTISGTLPSGRKITVEAAGEVNTSFEGSTAKVTANGRSIVIEPDNLEIDGQDIAEIPSDARHVEVIVRGTDVRFIVDGKPMG